MSEAYDFSGIATAYGVLCKDGRVINQGAFDHQIGQQVPLVWRHAHSDITNFLGHGYLRANASPPGVRIEATFNETSEGLRAKQLVKNEDLRYLSIYANELLEHSASSPQYGMVRGVNKGTIREVSLVLAGMNPGALIDDVVRHSDDPLAGDQIVLDGILIHTDTPIELFEEPQEPTETLEHEDSVIHEDSEETVASVVTSLNEDQESLFAMVIHSAMTGETLPSSESVSIAGDGPTIEETFQSLSTEQENVLYYLAGEAAEEEQEEILSQGDSNPMKPTHNIFEDQDSNLETLTHEQVLTTLAIARDTRVESLRVLFENQDVDVNHLSHSITDIDNLFPDAKDVGSGGPQLYSRPMEWVERVLSACNTRPFSRIKSRYADITGADARAKGYVTGAQKVEEVIAVLQRVTTPQTIYKLQKLDRDDLLDITDFDVVVWLKGEMRLMLREELARAVLISDGRNNTGADAIQTANVRPIYNDNAVYTINRLYNVVGDLQPLSAFDNADTILLIDYIAESMKDYLGSGSPTFYCQPEVLTKFMLIRDTLGHRLHPSKSALAAALGVADILPIPVMTGMQSDDVEDPTGIPDGTYDVATLGVIVNLRDYVIGADKGGQTSFFEDFDLNYNKHEYLYETRVSAALINPKSAICIQMVTAGTPD